MQLAERFKRERKEWFGNPIGDLCGSLVTTFALIPEVIGFMIVVGLPPYMGLFTCIFLTIITSFLGGCPGLVSAGAGSTALVLSGLISQYFNNGHPEYIFASIFLAGIIMVILGVCRFGSLVKYIPTSVMNGFVNGFATGVGYLIAIVLLAGIREKMEYNDIPESFQGMPIVLLTAALMAIAFFGFSGIV